MQHTENERKLLNFLRSLKSHLNNDLIEEIIVRIEKCLQERSRLEEKVLELRFFLAENFPAEMEANEETKPVIEITKNLLLDFKRFKNELTPEEITVNDRLLAVLREQFKCYYQGFDGSFEDWLETRGLYFNEDRFAPVIVEQRQKTFNCQPLQEQLNQSTCFTNAKPEEPVFVLRGQDATAGATVREWIRLNATTAPLQKLHNAIMQASEIERFKPKKTAD